MKKKVIILYVVFATISFMAFVTLRWLSFREPKKVTVVEESFLEPGDPRLGDIKVDKNMEYFIRQEKTIITKAGKFPFLEEDVKVKTTKMSRPSWKGL